MSQCDERNTTEIITHMNIIKQQTTAHFPSLSRSLMFRVVSQKLISVAFWAQLLVNVEWLAASSSNSRAGTGQWCQMLLFLMQLLLAESALPVCDKCPIETICPSQPVSCTVDFRFKQPSLQSIPSDFHPHAKLCHHIIPSMRVFPVFSRVPPRPEFKITQTLKVKHTGCDPGHSQCHHSVGYLI